jgi:O-acetylserine/cysteine efflux transporter
MRANRYAPLAALVAAGIGWGTTVPLTKVALAGWGPEWLTVIRFALAALPLAWVARRRLRAATSPATIGWGVFGYGGVIVLQNAGIARTSVSHAALIAGAAPVLVALFTVVLGRGRVGPSAWCGFAATLTGIGVIASHGGAGATFAGDALVFGSVLLSAAFVVAQPGMLAGRDPVAVTAVQLAAAAAGSVPAALLTGGVPAALPGPVPLLATGLLVTGGTLAPFTLFAFGQSRVSPEVAGAFLNLEPLAGALIGALAFGNPVGLTQAAGGAAVLGGIGLTAASLIAAGRRRAPGQHEPAGTRTRLMTRRPDGATARRRMRAGPSRRRPAVPVRSRPPGPATGSAVTRDAVVRDRRRSGRRARPARRNDRGRPHPLGPR